MCNNQHKIWLGEWMNYFVRQRYKQDNKIQKKILDFRDSRMIENVDDYEKLIDSMPFKMLCPLFRI